MDKPDIKNLIEEARRLSDAATPGPWRTSLCLTGVSCWCRVVDQGEHDDRGVLPSGCASKRDAEFIAFARTALPDLIDALEAKDREVEQIRENKTAESLRALADMDAACYFEIQRERDALRAEVDRLREAVYGPRDMSKGETIECTVVRLRQERDHYRDEVQRLRERTSK